MARIMARIADLPWKYRIFFAAYRFRRIDPCPWTPPRRALAESRVALVTTAAFYLSDQKPFDENLAGGDPSYRILPADRRTGDGPLASVQIGHRSAAFDHRGIEEDVNLALPVDRFLDLQAEGVIGTLHAEALSFMGSITAPGRLRRHTAPEAAERLRNAAVDVAFLCPV